MLRVLFMLCTARAFVLLQARPKQHRPWLFLRREGSTDRSTQPPKNYTDLFKDVASEISLSPIAVVQSPYRERFGVPRQAPVTGPGTLGGQEQNATIQFLDDRKLWGALEGVEGFEYVWVVSWLHLNKGWKSLVQPPRGKERAAKQGLFATRAPHRPNPIGDSADPHTSYPPLLALPSASSLSEYTEISAAQ